MQHYQVNPISEPRFKLDGQEQMPRYDLRWVFEFANKPTKYGQWSRPATNQQDMAAFVNKDGLIRAYIQAKNFYTRELHVVAECVGHEFVNFKWDAERHSLHAGTGLYSFAHYHNLVGLRLVCRDVEVAVSFNGETKVEHRTEEDKQFHYEGFGR